MLDILLTCPAMIRRLDHYRDRLAAYGFNVYAPEVKQILPERELIELVPKYDGWIIGDDPATAAVFRAGKAGRLRGAVKWGVGVDNVDFEGARACGIPIANTPGCFNDDVADLAVAYLVCVARQFHFIDAGTRTGQWRKPRGVSLTGKRVALLGFGNIGKATARRLLAMGMKITAYDPLSSADSTLPVEHAEWPSRLEEADFLILTCALTPATRRILNADTLAKCKPGVRIVNVSRGQLIDEQALAAVLASGHVHSAALEVFDQEPPSADCPLLRYENCVFGSHNASNTEEGVDRASDKALELLRGMLL